MVLAMTIFGTIGIFRRLVDMPSGMLACLRGLIGTVFLVLFLCARKQRPDLKLIKQHLPLLCLSGALIGINWILLFEAYRYTTVATATLCYYMAPVFVILAAALFFKERMTPLKWICVAVALLGMVLVSGILKGETGGSGNIKGVLLGLGAAVLYAVVVLINRTFSGVPAIERTVFQLGSAAAVLIPYVLLAEDTASVQLSGRTVLLVLLIGILHTGVAYLLYFASMDGLKIQTVALFSYIDPVVAVLLSTLLLKEDIGPAGWIGAVLILGATLVNELSDSRADEA